MSAPIDAVTWIAAFDGGKALIWRNEGFDDQPNLILLEHYETETPPDRELTSDRQGRRADPVMGRSGMESVDHHALAKADFVRQIVDRLNTAADSKSFDRLVLIAPDKALGQARPLYGQALKDRLIERNRDVAHETTEQVELQFKAAVNGLAA